MPKIDHDTKERILLAAEKVFHANGFKGTRTELIAIEAGISRTMLHYYFRSKEELFQEVLQNTMGAVFTNAQNFVSKSHSIFEVIDGLIDMLYSLFELKPGLPSFIVNILNESPEMAVILAENINEDLPKQIESLLKTAQNQGEINPTITSEDLIMNIYGMCSLPYLGKNYIKVKSKRNDEKTSIFNKNRVSAIKDFYKKGIRE